jgi:hypothetical protein
MHFNSTLHDISQSDNRALIVLLIFTAPALKDTIMALVPGANPTTFEFTTL